MLAIIGGTGLNSLDSIKSVETIEVETPFGKPSGMLSIISDGENKIVFLARHGAGHALLPSEINYRANIWALKSIGITAIMSVSAVGSLQAELAPGSFVIPNQYIDHTKGVRAGTFFGGGLVGHISTANVVCKDLVQSIVSNGEVLNYKIATEKTYICVEGPRLGTRAESRMFRSFGADIIGMTNVPEVFLAKEAQIAYASLCIVTDYDSWKEEPENQVSVVSAIKVYGENISRVQKLISLMLQNSEQLGKNSQNRNALEHAVLSDSLKLTAEKQELLRVLKL